MLAAHAITTDADDPLRGLVVGEVEPPPVPDDWVEVTVRATALNHHLTEEELTILNPARAEVSAKVRAELGRAFAEERAVQLDADCGRVENVRRIVARAEREGVLPAEEDE